MIRRTGSSDTVGMRQWNGWEKCARHKRSLLKSKYRDICHWEWLQSSQTECDSCDKNRMQVFRFNNLSVFKKGKWSRFEYCGVRFCIPLLLLYFAHSFVSYRYILSTEFSADVTNLSVSCVQVCKCVSVQYTCACFSRPHYLNDFREQIFRYV